MRLGSIVPPGENRRVPLGAWVGSVGSLKWDEGGEWMFNNEIVEQVQKHTFKVGPSFGAALGHTKGP